MNAGSLKGRKSKDRPLITVGVTAFNAESTIEKAVIAAVKQTWPNIEIVIVHDCSTDRTAAKLEVLQRDYPFLKIFHQKENKGVAASRNEIIRMAEGQFLAFFDDDDVSDPARLERQYERIAKYEEDFARGDPVICHTARTQFYPDGKIHYEITPGTAEGAAPHGHEVAERILTGKHAARIFGSMATCSQMARLSLYQDLGGFDEYFRRSEDTDFNIRAAMNGTHFVGIKEPLVKQEMTRASDKSLEGEKLYTLSLLEKHREFIKTVEVYDFCREWTKAKYEFLQGRKTNFIFKLIFLMLRHPVLTMRRFFRAFPNRGFNLQSSQFYTKDE